MMDPWMGFGGVPIAPPSGETRTQRTSGGVAVVDQGNASKRLLSPSGITRGLSLNRDDLPDAEIFTGRVSLSLLAAALLLLVGGYIWTRNVQGGG